MTSFSNLSLFPMIRTPSTKTTQSNTVSFKTRLTQLHQTLQQLSSQKVRRKTLPSSPKNALLSHLTTTHLRKPAKTAKRTKNTSHCAKNAFQLFIPPIQKQNTSSSTLPISFSSQISTFPRPIPKEPSEYVPSTVHWQSTTSAWPVLLIKYSTLPSNSVKKAVLMVKYSVKPTPSASMPNS